MIPLFAFEALCASEPYRAKGLFYSEVFLFLEACEAAGVDLIIESGVKNGMSTALICAAWPGELVSIDKEYPESFAGLGRATFMLGDSRELLPALLKRSQGRRAGVLIDGPKGTEALRLRAAIWSMQEARVVAIHDLAVSTPGCSRHSQRADFRRDVGDRLDRFVEPVYRAKYPAGPGLAIWEKQP